MKRRSGLKFSQLFIIITTAILVAIILLNIMLMYDIASEQTEEIGQMRLQNIAAGFQKSLTRAENTIDRVSDELEILLKHDASREEIRQFLSEQKLREYKLSNGICLNVFCVINGEVMVSDMETPEGYVIQDRMWYRGLLANRKQNTYISATYEDAFTDNNFCFTISRLLSDGRSIAAVDYSVTEIQSYIAEMSSDGYGDAIIVDENETIVGYIDPDLIGTKLYDSLPEYRDVFLRAIAMGEDNTSLQTEIDGFGTTIFCSRTENGWYMMCGVSNRALYKNNYGQLLRNFVLVMLLVFGSAIFSIIAVRHRRRLETSLRQRNETIAKLSEQLSHPLHEILESGEGAGNESENAKRIYEAGLTISKCLDALPKEAESSAPKEKAKQKRWKRQRTDLTAASQRRFQVGITFILVSTMIAALSVITSMTVSESHLKMESDLQEYSYEIGDWILEQKLILDMFNNVIAAKPEMLDDYEGMVSFLDDITKHYPKISATYIANPDFPHGHPMVMNNGWVPDPDYVEEERPWYTGALTAEDFNITEPYYDARTGEYCITLSEVVASDSGEFYGVFAIDFYLDVLMDILGESYSETGYAFLVDHTGLIIDHPYSEYRLSSEGAESIHNLVYEEIYRKAGLVTLRDYDGELKVCTSMDEPTSGFRLVVVKDWWSIYANIIQYGVLFLLLFGGCIVLINLVIHRMIRWQERANEELKEAADSAIQAEHAKSQFFSSVSHEIRTPINAVLGMNEMILRECTDESLLSYAASIQASGRTLLSLVNDVLDISKIESGKMRIMPVEYEPGELISDLWGMSYLRAQEKDLSIHFSLDESLPKVLFGDDVRIKQILMNLLSNALKYTHTGGIELHASYISEGSDSLSLVISVKDTGIGIRKEDLNRMFESFQRLDEIRNRNIEGSGLGMTITLSLLKQMGGTMQVDSEYNKGSTFTVTIPQKVIDHAPTGSFESLLGRQRQVQVNKHQGFEAPGARVLTVDDNKLNLTVFKALLQRTKIQVDTARSGREGLGLAAKHAYDIIFMDHMMPEMDGVETLHELRKMSGSPNANTPVIVLTANALSDAKEKYLGLGFTDFMTKPIDAALLERMIVHYLPKNLVRPLETSGEPVEPEAPESDAQTNRGVSVRQGLHYAAGNMDIYLDLIEMFLKDSSKREQLAQYLADGNLEDYRILVHALKSNARTLGAKGLADMAFYHEKESKAGNTDAVKAHWQELCAVWDSANAEFKDIYREHRGEIAPDDGAASVAGSALALSQEELSEVAALVKDFEFDRAIGMLKEWLTHPLEAETHRRVQGALTALEQEFDQDLALELLNP